MFSCMSGQMFTTGEDHVTIAEPCTAENLGLGSSSNLSFLLWHSDIFIKRQK